MLCAACGVPAAAGAKFCFACGTPLAAVVPAVEERRVVTVVFCDLVGSTALSGVLDSEVLREVTLRYFDLMQARIEAHGGTVEKFIGDAVMAVFGVPVMHEDDARRALAATLDMTASLAEFNVDLAATLGIRLDVRIGVNTGEVIATTDASARQALVSGEVVNVAARLEQNAGAGEVLLGELTLRAVGAAAVVAPAGPLTLKGKAEPVLGYRLLDLLPDDPEVVRRFDVPFVGREHESAELDLIRDRVHRQRACHLVTLYGEAGIGKTRLLRTWQQGLDPAAELLGTGRCRPYGEAGTLLPLADAVEQLLDTARVHGLHLPEEAMAVLRRGLLKDGAPNPSVAETVSATATLLAELSQDAVVVLSIDDCHWAPPVLLDVLDELAEYVDREAVLLICAARPDLLDVRPGWGSGRLNASSMVLQGLSESESMLLAAELVEFSAHDAGTSERIVERSEGNPLHLEQLFASLTDEGTQGPLPPTVFALLAARIDALGPAERLVLDLAAIIGSEFDGEALQLLVDGEPAENCGPTLRELTRRRLIEPVRKPIGARAGHAYRFSNGLIQEVAYKGMAKRIRSQRHERFAGCLDAVGASVAEVAGHYERAYRYRAELGSTEADTETLRIRAAEGLGRAGASAQGRADLHWAADLLGRAVELTHRDEPGWPRVAQRLAEVSLVVGRRPEGLELLYDVLVAATKAGDAATAAHARLQIATHSPSSPFGTAAEASRAAVEVFRRTEDHLGLARAGIRIAQDLQFQGRHGEAEELLLRAVEQARLADAEPERAMALGAVGVSLWLGPTEASAAIDRCRQLLGEHGADRTAVRATVNCPLAVLLALRDRHDEAAECLAIAAPLARSLGYAESEVFLPLFGATVAAHGLRFDRAEDLLQSSLRACVRLGATGMQASVSRDLARLLLRRGEWREADRLTAAGGTDAAAMAPSEAADQLGVRARIAALAGDAALAAKLAERAGAEADRTDSPISHAVADADAAHVLFAAGRIADAEAAAHSAEAWFGRKGHLVGVRQARELQRQFDTSTAEGEHL